MPSTRPTGPATTSSTSRRSSRLDGVARGGLPPGRARHEDESTTDPHVWLDPRTMITITRDVEKRLADADPDHASDFAANARRLEGELTQLDTAFSDGLKTCRTRTIVTSHAAFHYLAERYRLTQVPIAGIDPTNEPTPAQLADISSLVKREEHHHDLHRGARQPGDRRDRRPRDRGQDRYARPHRRTGRQRRRRDLPDPDEAQSRRDPDGERLLHDRAGRPTTPR